MTKQVKFMFPKEGEHIPEIGDIIHVEYVNVVNPLKYPLFCWANGPIIELNKIFGWYKQRKRLIFYGVMDAVDDSTQGMEFDHQTGKSENYTPTFFGHGMEGHETCVWNYG